MVEHRVCRRSAECSKLVASQAQVLRFELTAAVCRARVESPEHYCLSRISKLIILESCPDHEQPPLTTMITIMSVFTLFSSFPLPSLSSNYWEGDRK